MKTTVQNTVGKGCMIVLKHGKYLCAKFFYNLAIGVIELSCILLWLLGKFINVDIDTSCLSTSECEKYIITITRENNE